MTMNHHEFIMNACPAKQSCFTTWATSSCCNVLQLFSQGFFDLTLHTYIFFVIGRQTARYTMYAWVQAYIRHTSLSVRMILKPQLRPCGWSELCSIALSLRILGFKRWLLVASIWKKMSTDFLDYLDLAFRSFSRRLSHAQPSFKSFKSVEH